MIFVKSELLIYYLFNLEDNILQSQTHIQHTILTQDQFNYLTRGLNKNTARYKNLQRELEITNLLLKIKKIQPVLKLSIIKGYKKFLQKVDSYYISLACENQWNYNGYSEQAIISYIRHYYTNYHYFIDLLDTLIAFNKTGQFAYLIDYREFYYNQFKNNINKLILNQFRDFFNWYKNKYEQKE